MAFDSKKKVWDYFTKCVRYFKVNDLEEVLASYFTHAFTYPMLISDLKQKKSQLSKKNAALWILGQVQKQKWSDKDILKTAFRLELEFIAKYHKKFTWKAHCFSRYTGQEQDIENLETSIRSVILSKKADAMVITKQVDEIIWISIVIKNLKQVGLYEKPNYIALSVNGKHFFTKQAVDGCVIESLAQTLGFEKKKDIKLMGRCVLSLMKLLHRKDNAAGRQDLPVYVSREAKEGRYGLDMTEKDAFNDYFTACLDDDNIAVDHYRIKAVNSKWAGDRQPELFNREFRTELVISGDVMKIISRLPLAGVVKPPFPNYLTNFTILGKNTISILKE